MEYPIHSSNVNLRLKNRTPKFYSFIIIADILQGLHCVKYFAGVYLMIGAVGSKLEDIEEEVDDEEDEEEEKKPVIILNVLDNCENFFAELLYEQEVCQTYLESFKNVS